MINSPLQKYQQSSVQTASRGQLIIMLYDGAIRFTRQGIAAIEESNIQATNHNLQRTQTIIHELVACLDMKYPIAQNLVLVYEYMLRRLIEANIKKKKEPAEEVLSYLLELKEAWVQAAKSSTAPQSHETTYG
ncbi:flagellar export chaperone FliS [Paenibacillus sambharensis]|uniref:Flagellar secretion chaperone FliS n=1 Tax=Paenibacillus sambharensis TaxID=1803190 RepID=A0A2W1LS87_9BACL|nr:flagellar export chaperone FliS [Paenibacillus sambharensis]PZD97842.1 flagellar export chaperone FliS [Paenibacillus sambharensis]